MKLVNVFMLSLFLVGTTVNAKEVLHANYDKDSDSIIIFARNSCRKVNVEFIPSCTKSIPGQTSIRITRGENLTQCEKTGLEIIIAEANKLGCRPAVVDILDESGANTSVEVPALAQNTQAE